MVVAKTANWVNSDHPSLSFLTGRLKIGILFSCCSSSVFHSVVSILQVTNRFSSSPLQPVATFRSNRQGERSKKDVKFFKGEPKI